MINVNTINALHRDSIILWKKEDLVFKAEDFYKLVEENHAFNYSLWHAEDKARRDDMGYEYVYKAKRAIDGYNQQRNNRMEAMDEWLFNALSPADHKTCPVNSETPGMMIDRLSIMALKAYHMELQTHRTDVDADHRSNCERKLATIREQQAQLSACLAEFIEEILAKKRSFRVYHQFKMYNDPTLNPELYKKG